MKKLLLIISIPFLVIGCQTDIALEKIALHTIHIGKMFDEKKVVDLSPRDNDSGRIIPLITPDNFIQPYISKVIYNGDIILTLDEISTYSVNLYDNQGNFIKRVGKRGKGPGETLQVSDIDLCKDTIYLLDNLQKSVLFYDIKGSFLTSISFPFIAEDLAKMDNGNFLFALSRFNEEKKYPSKIIVTDVKGKPLKSILHRPAKEKDKNHFYLQIRNPIYKFNNYAYFYDHLSSILYIVDEKGEIKNSVQFDMGKYKIPDKSVYDYSDFEEYKRISPVLYFEESPIPTGNFYAGLISNSENVFFSVFNDSVGSVLPITMEMLQNQKVYVPVGSYGDSIVGFLENSLEDQEASTFNTLIIKKMQ